jgi:hypothetical protein
MLLTHDEIDIDRDPLVAVFIERKCADDGVRQTLRLQDGGQPVERELRFCLSHEEPPAVVSSLDEPGLRLS